MQVRHWFQLCYSRLDDVDLGAGGSGSETLVWWSKEVGQGYLGKDQAASEASLDCHGAETETRMGKHQGETETKMGQHEGDTEAGLGWHGTAASAHATAVEGLFGMSRCSCPSNVSFLSWLVEIGG